MLSFTFSFKFLLNTLSGYDHFSLSSPDSDEFLPHYARSTAESRNKRNTPK